MCSISFWAYAWRHSMVSFGNAEAVRILWGTKWYCTYYIHELRNTSSVSWLIRSVAGFLPAENRVRSRMNAGQICDGRGGTLPDFSSQYFGIPCQYVQNCSLFVRIFISVHLFIRRTSGRCLGTVEQSSVLSDIGEHWTQKLSVVVLQLRP
jgi:hypothetical protein